MSESRPRGIYAFALLICAGYAAGSEPTKGPEIHIARATGPITIDGDLDDPGWQGVPRVETWYETNPGDNLPAKLKNVGFLAYDDKFLYAGFSFADSDPSKIRARQPAHQAGRRTRREVDPERGHGEGRAHHGQARGHVIHGARDRGQGAIRYALKRLTGAFFGRQVYPVSK